MESEHEGMMNTEEAQFSVVFGDDIGTDIEFQNDVSHIIYNEPAMVDFALHQDDADNLSDLAWELLGRYIAINTHLKKIDLQYCSMIDAKMAALFSRLTKSASIRRFNLMNNEFGMDGVRSMVPFLENAPHLEQLLMNCNNNVGTECFEMLISALNRSSSMEELRFNQCNIADISALNTYTLPNLRLLTLNGNNIGRDGCNVVSNLLQKEDSSLIELDLVSTGMGDDEAEIIASSLKHNTNLQQLHLGNNNIRQRGGKAFLKLLNDISSIESTYKSNHSLKVLGLPHVSHILLAAYIDTICGQNRASVNPADAGRTKVIYSQLNSQIRKHLCQLQDIEYSVGNIFADIEPILLPSILPLIGNRHTQSELYTALKATAPDLLSFIDRKAMIRDEMTKNIVQENKLIQQAHALIQQAHALHQQAHALRQQATAVNAKNNPLSKRLEMINSGDNNNKQCSVVGEVNKMATVTGKKRERSES